jgi:hypothetical protein
VNLTTELKIQLLACLREEFEDDTTMTPVVANVEALAVGYDLTQVDRDPTWDELVEDENWVLAWLEYFGIISY